MVKLRTEPNEAFKEGPRWKGIKRGRNYLKTSLLGRKREREFVVYRGMLPMSGSIVLQLKFGVLRGRRGQILPSYLSRTTPHDLRIKYPVICGSRIPCDENKLFPP